MTSQTSTATTKPGKINFNISAPGKIILHGEHSVVYNKLALAASLDLRTHANLTEIINIDEQQQQQIQLNFTNFNYKIHFPINNIMQLLLTKPIPILEQYQIEDYNYTKPEILNHLKLLEIIKEFLQNHANTLLINDDKIKISLLSLFYLIYGIFVGFNLEILPFSLTIDTDLSIGAGTGSSASYLVTLSATLINYIKLKQPPTKYNHKLFSSGGGGDGKFNDFELDLISRWAYCAEKIIHGTPSGIDNTICTYGSMIEFRKNNKIEIVKFNKQLPLLLINTKIQRNTRLLVEKVANLYKNHPITICKIFEAIDELAQEAAIYLKKINNDDNQDIDDCYEKLMELSTINHNLLRSLNVSHPKLDAICQILQEFKLDGKLTGAGGGGYAICLIPPKFNQQQQQIQQIIKQLESIDCQTIYTNLGGEGVKID